MSRTFQTLFLIGFLLSAPGWAQEEAGTPSPEELVERILELHRRIEELMAELPPEARAEVLRRLAESAAAPPDAAPPAVESAPPAVPEPAPPAVPEPAPPAPPLPPPVVEPVPASDVPKLIRRRSRRPECNTLRPLDENGDGRISAADRYWRHLYLWTDRNGDRQPQEREVASAYDRRVREIAVSLETFIRSKGGLGEIRIEEAVVLDLRGDGFAERARRDDAVLVVDATALSRGGGPRLLGPGGEALEGYQPFRSGLRLDVAGELTEITCP